MDIVIDTNTIIRMHNQDWIVYSVEQLDTAGTVGMKTRYTVWLRTLADPQDKTMYFCIEQD